MRTSDFPPSRIATTDIGKGLPQAAPRTELFPLKLCTGIFPSLTKLTVSSGQFDARIISLALPESTALEDCLEPRCTSPVSNPDDVIPRKLDESAACGHSGRDARRKIATD